MEEKLFHFEKTEVTFSSQSEWYINMKRRKELMQIKNKTNNLEIELNVKAKRQRKPQFNGET